MKNKNIVIMFLVFMVISLLAGCGSVSSIKTEPSGKTQEANTMQEETVTFDRKDIGITFEYPKEYIRQKKFENGSIKVAFQIGKSRASVVLETEKIPGGKSPGNVLNETIQTIKHDGHTKILTTRTYTKNNINFIEFAGTRKTGKVVYTFIIHNGTAYLFTYGAQSDIFDKYLKGYNNLLESVKIK